MIVWAKVGGILLAVALVFGFGFWTGHTRGVAALEGFQAAQAENTAKAVLNERASAAAELARRDAIIKGYQDAPPDPIVATAAHRLYIYAGAANCPVHEAAAVASGTPGSAPVAIGPSPVERALNAYIEACAGDAAQMRAMIDLAQH